MKHRFVPRVAVPALLLFGGCTPAEEATEARSGAPSSVPSFQVDPDWPDLPEDWVFGNGIGLFVDHSDHVWFSHRAEVLSTEDLERDRERPGIPAPLVMEFDPEGRLVQTWGDDGRTEDWPAVLHGFFVDSDGSVWSSARDQHQVMKFDRDGGVVLTIGSFDERGDSNDPDRLGRPSDIHVDPETNEVFVADGYDNRRVVVFDAESGRYLRHWGAYGEPPDDDFDPRMADSDSTPPQFDLLHGIAGSRDGLLYVADQRNSRIQVFETDGTFVAERVVRAGAGGATAVAVSTDPGEQFLFVADGSEDKIFILRRDDLEVVGEFGDSGREPGQFGRPHNVAVDSRGNLYVVESNPGRRIQKFTPRE